MILGKDKDLFIWDPKLKSLLYVIGDGIETKTINFSRKFFFKNWRTNGLKHEKSI